MLDTFKIYGKYHLEMSFRMYVKDAYDSVESKEVFNSAQTRRKHIRENLTWALLSNYDNLCRMLKGKCHTGAEKAILDKLHNGNVYLHKIITDGVSDGVKDIDYYCNMVLKTKPHFDKLFMMIDGLTTEEKQLELILKFCKRWKILYIPLESPLVR